MPLTNVTDVFVDTSVLMSASLSATGNARTLMQCGAKGVISLVWSDAVIVEIERNLTKKAPKALSGFYLLRDSGIFKYVTPPETLVTECHQIVHSKDASILAACVYAQIQWLATYDQKHLLAKRSEIRERYDVAIARPDEILESLGLHPGS